VVQAHLGRAEEAKHALAAAIAKQPNLSVNFARRKM
jgi:hypothetical protein